MNQPRTRLVRVALGIASAAAVAVAFLSTRQDAAGLAPPSAGRVLLACIAVGFALLAAGGAWAALLRPHPYRALLPGFLGAQLARYIPGSVWQGVSQVLDVERLGVRRSAATTAFLVQLGTQVVAGVLVGLLALLDVRAIPAWLVIVLVIAPLLAVPLLHRGWMRSTIAWLAARSRRVARLDLVPPPQRAIIAATGFGVVNLAFVGAAFGLLLPSARSTRDVVAAAGVFAVAWVVGFLIVPLPAGLGAREAVLALGLAASHPVAAVLGTAVILRLVMIVVEVGLAAVAQGYRRYVAVR